MAKVKLDVGAEVDFLNKGELDDSLRKANEERARGELLERVRGIKYIRPPQIQGTVYNGTINGSASSPAGTAGNAVLGGAPWGPQSGYAWSIRRIAIGGLANTNGTNPDTVGVYRNNNNQPPIGMITANTPSITFPTLGAVLLGGDSIVLGHIGSQVASNNYGTLVSTFIRADFDVIEVPMEMLGKLA